MSEEFEIWPEIGPSWEDVRERPWSRVSGGGLKAPIYVRIGRTSDQRLVISGLILGAGWPDVEVTADVLRSIRVGAILQAMFDGLDTHPDWEDLAESVEWGLTQQFAEQAVDRMFHQSQSSTRGPSMEQLEEFATIYNDHYARTPHRATSATVASYPKAQGMNRAKAIRWAARCRELGLIPPRASPG